MSNFQDIFLFVSIPATVSSLCILFEKNYWEMAGFSWVTISILKIMEINFAIGLICVLIGIGQIAYGLKRDYEKKKVKENIRIWFQYQIPIY